MTTHQAIALLFPLAAGSGALLTAFIAKKVWVDRPVPADSRIPDEVVEEIVDLARSSRELHGERDDLKEAAVQAHRLIDIVRNTLQKTL
ncbi:MAG TPA: hypothetical protein VF901_19395 [Bradyrhizobium sp.]